MDFKILGPLEVMEDGRRLELGGAKQRTLLATLLLHPNEVVSSDRLIDALWEDAPPESGRKALQVYVSGLRKALGKERLQTQAPGYLLRVLPDELDLERFERLTGEGRAAEALALWRGPVLQEFAYQRFAAGEIERIEELRVSCLEERVEDDLARGRHAALVGELEALVREHPLRERLRGQLMLALYRSGRQAEALEAYQDARRTLVDELGIEPTQELQSLHRAILNQEHALVVEPARASNLPTPATPLIGRRDEMEAIVDLLLAEVRLVTITGAGGSGKTRLALEVGRYLAAEVSRQVCLVSLASLGEAELVPTTVLSALGSREVPGGSPLETLKRSLRERELVLVLDNFEHVLEAAPLLAELLAECPRLKMLVTSRASLRLSAEHEYPLEPLPLKPAVALFTERARAVSGRFAGEESVLTAICERLDCLPLALELAAVRSRMLAPVELLQRLEDALSVLTGGPRDLAARQQTLRATIDWSHALLGPDERRVFAWLAAFRGGCTLEAAEEVCGASLDQLQSLVDQSLVRRRETPVESRFSMLETIREYALERLRSADSEAARAHADYYLALAEREAESLKLAEPSTLARHELELDNIRAAFAWMERNDRHGARRLASALSSYWYTSGRLLEGRRWFESVVSEAPTPSRELAVVAAELARLLCFLGDNAAATDAVEYALGLADDLELPDVLSEALNTKHLLLYNAGRASEALSMLERALAIARDDDSTGASLPRALYNLAYQMRVRDRLAESQAIDLEGLELARRSGSKSYEEFFLGHLLESHVRLGEWEAALAVAVELEDDSLPRGTFDRLSSLPWLHVQRGEVARARDLLEAYRHLAGSEDLQARLVHSIAEAAVLRAEGRPHEALAAAQAALAERDSLGPHGEVTFAWVEAVEVAFELDDLDRVRGFVDEWDDVRPLEQPSFLEGNRARFAAGLAARLGDAGFVEPAFKDATKIFRTLSMPFYVAITLLEHAEWVIALGRARDASELLTEADAIFRTLDAKPWAERTRRALVTTPAVDSIA